MIKSLSVWWDGAVAGALRIDEHGDLSFAYDPDWLADPTRTAVSLSLPKRREPFDRRETRPFFAGLLPEEGQREAVARALGVSRANDFRLLEQLGGDVAGALTLWPEGDTPPAGAGLDEAEPLDDARLVEVLDTLPDRPFLAGEEGLRLSLAGAQQKLPVVLVNGRIALPRPGQPSTHILKPPISLLTATTENEALAMRLALGAGLPAAPVEARRTADRPYLLVERYEPACRPGRRRAPAAQEDFCQALGIAPEKKYASEGGPTFPPCFDLVRRACLPPAPAILQLLDAAIFNVILGNADAHGKNFSLLYRPQGIGFAPLYDLMCTAAYPGVHAKLAMKIGKRATLEEFTPTTWQDFGREIGIGPPFVRRRATALAERTLEVLPPAADGVASAGFEAPSCGGSRTSSASAPVGCWTWAPRATARPDRTEAPPAPGRGIPARHFVRTVTRRRFVGIGPPGRRATAAVLQRIAEWASGSMADRPNGAPGQARSSVVAKASVRTAVLSRRDRLQPVQRRAHRLQGDRFGGPQEPSEARFVLHRRGVGRPGAEDFPLVAQSQVRVLHHVVGALETDGRTHAALQGGPEAAGRAVPRRSKICSVVASRIIVSPVFSVSARRPSPASPLRASSARPRRATAFAENLAHPAVDRLRDPRQGADASGVEAVGRRLDFSPAAAVQAAGRSVCRPSIRRTLGAPSAAPISMRRGFSASGTSRARSIDSTPLSWLADLTAT